jgi:hypothetical protein
MLFDTSKKKQNDYMDVGMAVDLSTDGDTINTESFEQMANKFGVVLPAGETEDRAEIKPEKLAFKKKAEWFSTPTYTDQLSKYPESCRLIGPKFEDFDLAKEGEKERLNTFMSDSLPRSSPAIVVQGTDKQFCEKTGNWKFLVTYYTVEYLRLLDPGKS